MYGSYAAPTSKPKRCCKRLSVSPKVLQKARPAHCEMPFAAWVFHVQYHQIKGAAKKTVEWCYILTYLHTDTLHPYTGAARVPMYYQRCSKRTSGATHIYIYIFMYLHYILTGAAMYHQRCCKKYLPVLTAQVLPKYQCTT